MNAALLRIVPKAPDVPGEIPWEEKLADHHAILTGYFDTFITQGFSPVSSAFDTRFLCHWFENQRVEDESHPDGERQLLLWEAMAPINGQERMAAYTKALMLKDLKRVTVMGYVSRLRRLFTYVLERPFIPHSDGQYIWAKYGAIMQPISRYEYPKHTLDNHQEGYALTGEGLLAFYSFIRDWYVPNAQKPLPAMPDYAMVVLAAESGLRADELCHLDALGPHRDLFYAENRIQTRYGKASRGSGKRTRKTIFSPLAQATICTYEEQVRPLFRNGATDPALFFAETGRRMNTGAMAYTLPKIVDVARKAGLELPPRLTWHDLRRSFITGYMKRIGRDRGELMHMVGHQSPSTLWRYVRYSQAECEQMLGSYYQTLIPANGTEGTSDGSAMDP